MYCCFQETSAAMSFVPGSLAAMFCLPCYCMLLTSRSSRRPAICPLSFSTSARGRKLKVPWRLAVHEHSTSTRMSSGTATTTPGGRRLLLLLFLSGVFMIVLMMTAMIRPAQTPSASLSHQQPPTFVAPTTHLLHHISVRKGGRFFRSPLGHNRSGFASRISLQSPLSDPIYQSLRYVPYQSAGKVGPRERMQHQ